MRQARPRSLIVAASKGNANTQIITFIADPNPTGQIFYAKFICLIEKLEKRSFCITSRLLCLIFERRFVLFVGSFNGLGSIKKRTACDVIRREGG